VRPDVLGNGTCSTLVAGAVLVLLGNPDAVAQQDWHILVDDPRPLAAAVKHVETLCDCIVTYEDPRWTREQVVDVTAQTRQDGRLDPQVFSPAGQPFEFWFMMPPSGAASTQLSESLRDLLGRFHASGNPGVFSVQQRGETFHVRPESGSVLDVPVSLPLTATREGELIRALLRAVSAAQHTTIVMGIGTDLGGWRIEESAANETAERVLTRLLTSRMPRRSWRLLYDFGSQKYVLNIHAVK
jgi:hypothetical protein